MASEGSRKRRARNVPARMAEYISDFVLDGNSSPVYDISSNTPPHPHQNNSKSHPSNSPNIPEDKEPNSNHDLCDTCGDGGDLICCDRCPASFHLLCVEPPLTTNTVPEGDWFCKQCTAVLFPPKLPKNPVAAALLRHFHTLNPRIYSLPKEIFEVAKKGKGFTENGEGGRQMGSGTTAVDVFGNSIILGTCSICTIEGKQEDIISCSVCKTLYHTYCMDPVLVSKPSGFWVCPNHDPNTLPLPPGVSKVVKNGHATRSGREVVHLIPGDSMRLDFLPSPYSEFDEDSEPSEDDDSEESGESDDSDDKANRSKPFMQMAKALREATEQKRNKIGQRLDARRRNTFDSYKYLEDFYDEEVFEEIDLFTPPEDQTRLLLNLGRPQRLRFNRYDTSIQSQSKQLDDLLAQQRLYAQAAMPAGLFGNPPPLPDPTTSTTTTTTPAPAPAPADTATTTPPTSLNGTLPDSTPSSTVDSKKDTDADAPVDMDTSTTSTTPAPASTTTTTSTSATTTTPATTSTPATTTPNTPLNPMDAIFGNGLASTPLALAQLTPLFTQFLAWQRLMQINQQIQQHQLDNAYFLPQSQQPQLTTEQQLQHLQQQQFQLRNFYEMNQTRQNYVPPPLVHPPRTHTRNTHVDPPRILQELRAGPPTLPSQPRIPARAKSPRSKPFAKSEWMLSRMQRANQPTPSPSSSSTTTRTTTHNTTAPPSNSSTSPKSTTNQTTTTSSTTTPTPKQFSNQPSVYSKPTATPDHATRSTPFSTPSYLPSSTTSTPNQSTTPLNQTTPASESGTPNSDQSTPHSFFPPSSKTRPGRKRKGSPLDAPTSPRKTSRKIKKPAKLDDGGEEEGSDKDEHEGEDIGKEENGKEGEVQVVKSKKKDEGAPVKLRGRGGRFVHKDPVLAAQALYQALTKVGVGRGKSPSAKKGAKDETNLPSTSPAKTDVEMKDDEKDKEKDKEEKEANEDREERDKEEQVGVKDKEIEENGIEAGHDESPTSHDSKGDEEMKEVDETSTTSSPSDEKDTEKESTEVKEEEQEKDEEDAREELPASPIVTVVKEKEKEKIKEKETEKEKEKEKNQESKETKESKESNEVKEANEAKEGSPAPVEHKDEKPPTKRSQRMIEKGQKNKKKEVVEAIKEKEPEEKKKFKRKDKKKKENEQSSTVEVEQEAGKKRKVERKKKENNEEKKKPKKKKELDYDNFEPVVSAYDEECDSPEKKEDKKEERKEKEESSKPVSSPSSPPAMPPIYHAKPASFSHTTPYPVTPNNNNNKNISTSKTESSPFNLMEVAVDRPITSEMLEAATSDNTNYPAAVATLNISVLDPQSDPKDFPPPITFHVTKRVTSIGRNRQLRRDGTPPPGSTMVDVDLAPFAAFSRAVSHLHAYLIHSPPSYRTSFSSFDLPEFSLWLVGRNYTKVGGIMHREGVVPLSSTSCVIKVSKLKIDFSKLD